VFPTDDILIARGKYSTLGKDRRQQLDRVQTICKTVMHLANPVLQDCSEQPPVNEVHLLELEKCVKNLRSAREKLVELGNHMNAIKPIAWSE
jgi:hypothetical protein